MFVGLDTAEGSVAAVATRCGHAGPTESGTKAAGASRCNAGKSALDQLQSESVSEFGSCRSCTALDDYQLRGASTSAVIRSCYIALRAGGFSQCFPGAYWPAAPELG